MKILIRKFIVVVMVFGLSAPFCMASHKGPRMNFSLSFGMTVKGLTDIHSFGTAQEEILKTTSELLDMDMRGQYDDIIFGNEFKGEISLDIFRYFGVGMSAGFSSRKKASRFSLRGDDYVMIRQYGPRLNVFYIDLNVYVRFPIIDTMDFYFLAGPTYSFTNTLIRFNGLESSLAPLNPLASSTKWDLTARGWGYHGGFGYKIDVGRHAALFFELYGLQCQMKNIQGNEIRVDSEGRETSGKGRLWYLKIDDSVTDQYYVSALLSEEEPSDEAYKDVRPFVMNISGLSFRTGITVKF